MDMDHNDAFKLIEDVPNHLIWPGTSFAQNCFELFPNLNTEWNTLHRVLSHVGITPLLIFFCVFLNLSGGYACIVLHWATDGKVTVLY